MVVEQSSSQTPPIRGVCVKYTVVYVTRYVKNTHIFVVSYIMSVVFASTRLQTAPVRWPAPKRSHHHQLQLTRTAQLLLWRDLFPARSGVAAAAATPKPRLPPSGERGPLQQKDGLRIRHATTAASDRRHALQDILKANTFPLAFPRDEVLRFMAAEWYGTNVSRDGSESEREEGRKGRKGGFHNSLKRYGFDV